MGRHARTADAATIDVKPIERPYQLFDFFEETYGDIAPLRRAIVQLRSHGAKTMVIERVSSATELDEENEDLAIATGNKQFESRSFRLSFFDQAFREKSDITHLKDENFIGYLIVKQDFLPANKRCRVYESVIKKNTQLHNFVRGEQKFLCHIAGKPLHVSGYLYCQQNGITNVCVHAALRTIAARFLPDHDLSYREINRLLNIDHVKSTLKDGVFSSDMVSVLQAKGIKYIQSDFENDKDSTAPFEKFIYDHIESGFPVIIYFKPTTTDKCHVISVFGHTFNQDAWVQSADRHYFSISQYVGPAYQKETKYIPSDSWLSMFVGHDDNVGSNLCIPRHYFQTKFTKEPGKEHLVNPVRHIISTLPNEVVLDPESAEAMAARYLAKYLDKPNLSNPWSRRYYKALRLGHVVLRPLLITGGDYEDHLKRLTAWDLRNRILPDVYATIQKLVANHRIWMFEISIPELFSAVKRKIGEILLRADINDHPNPDITQGKRVFLLARFPGRFFRLREDASPKSKSSDLFKEFPSGIEEHSEVYGCEENTK